MDTANACFGAHPKSLPKSESVTKRQVLDLFDLPLPDLLLDAQLTHREHFDPREIRASTLVSLKTGACTEDCAYCAQSSHHAEPVPYQALMSVQDVLEAGTKAKAAGATRLCMGAAWRSPRSGPQFDTVLDMVRGVKGIGWKPA